MRVHAINFMLLFIFLNAFLSNAQFCSSDKQWVSNDSPLPFNISHITLADVYNGELYVVGVDTVLDLNNQHFEVFKLDTITNDWVSITPLVYEGGGAINDFKVYGGELFVGGTFNNLNGNISVMARYDGIQWNGVPEISSLGGYVYDMEIYNGDLYVGGDFVNAGTNFNGIAKYDGLLWSSLGQGLELNNPNVFTMAVLNNLLYIGGIFTQTIQANNEHYAAWNGTNWINVPTISGNRIDKIVATDTSIVAYAGSYIWNNENIGYYDGNQWNYLGSLPAGFGNSFHEFIYCDNGLFGFDFLSEMRVLSFENGAWQFLPPLSRTNGYSHIGKIFFYKDRLIVSDAASSCGSTLDKMAFLCDSIACGVLEGTIYVDTNTNCLNDNEPSIPVVLLHIQPNNQNVSVDSNGYYHRLVTTGNYDLSVITPQYYTAYCPATTVNASVMTPGQVVTNDFSISADPNIKDLEVIATQYPASVGFPTQLYITARNVGTEPLAGNITINCDSILIYDSCNVSLTLLAPNQFNWDFGNLNPYETADATLYFNVPVDITLIGSTLINSIIGDVTTGVDPDLSNNEDSSSVIITAAYDPNIKTVEPAGEVVNGTPGYVPVGTDKFEYVIHFQNTGTDTAQTVSIIDMIDANLDVSSLIVLSSSHPVVTNFFGMNGVEFEFNNINLPDSNVNFIESQGFVKFIINSIAGLTESSTIQNYADIYFDFNPAVTTNTVTNYFFEELSLDENSIPLFVLYPNPTNGSATLYSAILLSDFDMVVTNTMGQIVEFSKEKTKSDRIVLDIAGPPGIYFIRISNQEEIIEAKLIKL